eukprot:2717401-Rhodomonas_salina.1
MAALLLVPTPESPGMSIETASVMLPDPTAPTVTTTDMLPPPCPCTALHAIEVSDSHSLD